MVLETYTGQFFDYDDPRPEQINLTDIARSLSYTARFGGHTTRFYSVAEHALLCHALVSEQIPNRPDLALAALHHDSHEAYLGDVPTPLKRTLEAEAPDIYYGLVRKVDDAIGAAIGLDPDRFHDPIVRQADADALMIEAQLLKKSKGEGPHWRRNRDVYSGRRLPAFWRDRQIAACEIDFLAAHRQITAAMGRAVA